MKIHPDFNDFIASLNKHGVEYVIVGSFALAFYAQPRATGDIDIWIRPTSKNVKSILDALKDFGFGSLKISEKDILSGNIIQLGYPPVRIDLHTILDGLESEEIWQGRKKGLLGEHHVFFISKDSLIKNKHATGRHKDLADLEMMGES